MSTQTLQRHFADCDLPIKIVESDPRPHFRWMPPRNFRTEDDFFFVDIVTQRHRKQHFRLFIHESATAHVMDKNPKTQHILIQTRCLPVNTTRERVSHVLLGHDERQLFVVRSTGVSSVRDALDRLRPWEVRRAEHLGLKVVRQGDWFFIPLRQPLNITNDVILHRDMPIGGPNAFRWGIRHGHPHIAEEQALVFRPTFDRNGKQWVPAGTELGMICVRGKIRHKEHATIELRTWHRVIQNTVPRDTGFIGYYD